MCSITGVGERLHKVLGQIERSLPFGLLENQLVLEIYLSSFTSGADTLTPEGDVGRVPGEPSAEWG